MKLSRPSPQLFESVVWPALLLAGGMVLLQVHAMPYWQARAGQVLGVLWSLQLEGTALWLLYQPGLSYRRAGVITAVLLVGVPLWQLSQPALNRIGDLQGQSRAAAVTIQSKAEGRREDQIATLKTRVDGYRAQLARAADALASATAADPAYLRQLVRERDRAQARLDAAEKALDARQDDQVHAAPRISATVDWMDWLRAGADILPGAFSLLLFQWMNVLAILAISRYRHRGYETSVPDPAADSGRPPEPPPPPRPTPRPVTETAVSAAVSALPAPAETAPAPEMKPVGESPVSPSRPAPSVAVPRGTARPARPADEVTIRRLQNELASRIKGAGGTAADWCDRSGVNPRDLSFLMNHFARVAANKETISAPKLAELVARYLPQAGQGTGA